jgi:prepilin-type N-terminal cleavage/methylation domain-containing protein
MKRPPKQRILERRYKLRKHRTMKLISPDKNRKTGGFTLIEMIGVLAVIAILAAVLIPKVFEAINSSRVSGAAMSCNSVKTAIADHYARWGSLEVNGTTGAALALTAANRLNYDTVLVGEGFQDKPYTSKIGAPAITRIEAVTITGNDGTTAIASPVVTDMTASVAANASFNLDGTAPVNDVVGGTCIMAVIPTVTLNDAWELNKRIDGESAALGNGAAPATDAAGRVKYTVTAGSPTTTVYVYLTHR